MSHIHIVGAGMAGLAAAVRLVAAGRAVTLWDSAKQAGGRCRSFEDAQLGCRIDNGNHLMLSGNWAVQRYARLIGAHAALWCAPTATIPFMDLRCGTRWTLSMTDGPVPVWVLDPNRRVAGASLTDHLRLANLLVSGPRDTVADRTPRAGPIYDRFVLPLTEAVMNAGPDRASARLLRAVLLETFARGGQACRPMIARDGLSEALVEPAIQHLIRGQTDIRLGQRLSGVECADGRVTALGFARHAERLGPQDRVILALPPEKTGPLLDLPVPDAAVPIVNVHFRLPEPLAVDTPQMLGLIGGTAHWLFRRGAIASVTVSNAERLAAEEAETIAAACWADIARALDLAVDPMPPVRVVKEKRATFLQTPAAVAKRPKAATRLTNLFLAGDWTDTGLPATIEGAIRSGFTAADKALAA
ncbi:MAG: hydroxysqualene dehydroxylase HpnE [Rhodothalassiaceae bacterium]